jgi:hypothetical protein
LDNKLSHQYLCSKLDKYGFDRMKCYSFYDYTEEELINYFMVMYKSIDKYIIMNDNIKKPKSNTKLNNRHSVINTYTDKNNKYLEIGVETCHTFIETHFNYKIGVDPSPINTIHVDNLIKKTSNDFFKENTINFDVIFIDGMHQTEYILTDINNSIKYLNENGKIFIDDILPISFDEQLKIPIKHYYENSILKYGEPWTGDVWKVIYYMLLNHKENFDFEFFVNKDYRGIGLFTIKNKFFIDEEQIGNINKYSYFREYKKYLSFFTT